MRRVLAIVSLLIVAALLGCGGTKTVTVRVPALALPAAPTTQSAVPCPPPPGEGFMGACTPKPVQVFPGGKTSPLVAAAAGAKLPDVSSWQGNVDWGAVKRWQVAHGWTPAGIFKMGEFGADPFAASNNAHLRALGMWRAGYWFVRNTGCQHEAGQIIAAARALGLRVVAEDIETLEARGYDACLTPQLKSAGLVVVEYTSPGSYPGGNGGPGNPAWIATFGSSFGCVAWTCHAVAWQCSDGQFGCVTDIPGIGRDDVNIDFGITKLGVAPPVDPYAKYPDVVLHFGHDHARERHTVEAWDQNRCVNPAHRRVCVTTRAHLVLLDGRIVFLAGHSPDRKRVVRPPRWSAPSKQIPFGSRHAGISARLSQRR